MNLNDPQKLNDPQNNWWQLCGALGVLQSAGVDLPWPEINAELLTLARQHGPAAGETSEARQMLATYRRLCLDRGLIRRGQLFTLSDSIHGPGR